MSFLGEKIKKLFQSKKKEKNKKHLTIENILYSMKTKNNKN